MTRTITVMTALVIIVIGALALMRVRNDDHASGKAMASLRADFPILPGKTVQARDSVAQIQFGSERVNVVPNARGEFPRVRVSGSSIVKARIHFPNAAAGAIVSVQADDGGIVGGADSGVCLDSDGYVNVEFRVAPNDGLQRITLRHGSDLRTLHFWVGPDAPVLVRKDSY